jgi:hypothetical protein
MSDVRASGIVLTGIPGWLAQLAPDVLVSKSRATLAKGLIPYHSFYDVVVGAITFRTRAAVFQDLRVNAF